MLSSQTKDPVTFAAMDRLKNYGLTPQNIVNIKTEDLEKLIFPVAFYKVFFIKYGSIFIREKQFI